MTDLKGKVALITGSGRGLGRAIAERYAQLGASLVLNYSSKAQATQDTVAAIEQFGGTAIEVQADVSKVADLDRLFSVNTKGLFSPCSRPRSMSPTTGASSTSAQARRPTRCPATHCTAAAR